MKGRTACPKCKQQFVLDVPEKSKEYNVVCPKCKNKFTIKPSTCDTTKEEVCNWEEHGEPRKTILSSIKPRTDKPMIAAILLALVFAIGMTTAALSETFINSTSAIFDNAGYKGTVEITIIDTHNNSLDSVIISFQNTSSSIINYRDGNYTIQNVTLGISEFEFSHEGFKTLNTEILVTPFITSTLNIKMEAGKGEINEPFSIFGCFTILVIFSIFALLGSISCLRRRNLDIAGVGSIIGIFSFGFFMIGSILSIVAFIIILISKKEFENGKKGKIF